MDASSKQVAKRDGIDTDIDIAIAGGGLAGGLIAWRLRQSHPTLNIVLVERGQSLGYGGRGYGGRADGGRMDGAHTWSFHATDLTQDLYDWIAPLITHRWEGQDVRFPKFQRTLTTPYCSVTSQQFAKIIGKDLSGDILYGQEIAHLNAHSIVLKNGRIIPAKVVIDCRGQQGNPHLSLGFQKFVGLEIEFDKPHGLSRPIIMDADIDQYDGYRFVYTLPFSAHTALVEDTRYADGADLDGAQIRKQIMDYCRHRGLDEGRVIREEEGVLPIALSGDIEKFWGRSPPDFIPEHGLDKAGPAARAGMSAALFHPLTGYSLPFAASLAKRIDLYIQQNKDFTGADIYRLTYDYSVQNWQDMGFYRLLCRMLFRAAAPENRYKVLERFYKFPQPLIERFYGGRSLTRDKIRVLTGKPPVPVLNAMKCLRDR